MALNFRSTATEVPGHIKLNDEALNIYCMTECSDLGCLPFLTGAFSRREHLTRLR